MSNKYAYDYYSIEMDSDIRAYFDNNYSDICECAFNQAREQARLYVIPCEWTLISDDGYTMIIRRKRNSKGV